MNVTSISQSVYDATILVGPWYTTMCVSINKGNTKGCKEEIEEETREECPKLYSF